MERATSVEKTDLESEEESRESREGGAGGCAWEGVFFVDFGIGTEIMGSRL